MSEHTPTPWRYKTPAHAHERSKISSDARLELGFVGEIGQTQKFWADMIGTKLGRPTAELLARMAEDEANAEFIVRAVNSHEGLVDLLRWGILVISGDNNELIHEWQENVQAAVAKARGKA